MQTTVHARSRCQQRGIPPAVVDLIVDFGAEVRSHGASKYYLDRKARNPARLAELRPVEPFLKCFEPALIPLPLSFRDPGNERVHRHRQEGGKNPHGHEQDPDSPVHHHGPESAAQEFQIGHSLPV